MRGEERICRWLGSVALALPAALAACAATDRGEPRESAEAEIAPAASAAPAAVTPVTSALTSATAASAAPPPTDEKAEPEKVEGEAAKGERVYAKARFTWIHAAPFESKSWIGYLTSGGSVRLKGGSAEAARVKGTTPKCEGWYAVEPVGYVCVGRTATLDPQDPVFQAVAPSAPRVTEPFPYRYGESIGTPRYPALPTPEEQKRVEWDLERHLENVRRAREAKDDEAIAAIDKRLVGVDLRPAGVPAPDLLDPGPLVRAPRPRVAPGSTVAYTRDFDAQGRSFLLTSDHAWIPKDRVRPYPESTFEGAELDAAARALPLAFFRKTPKPRFERRPDGTFTEAGTFPVRSHVFLEARAPGEAPEAVESAGERYLKVRGEPFYARESDATVLGPSKRVPLKEAEIQASAKWVEVSVLGGWLIAYEGTRPVFATLVAAGRGGVPYAGKDPVSTASTPTGIFRVDGKFRTATMVSSSDSDIVHAEVQFVQNFHGPHSLHGAYWHDAFGELKSGGCVNLSPRDARRLFAWTDPPMPEDWHGVRATKTFGRSTTVVVHR